MTPREMAHAAFVGTTAECLFGLRQEWRSHSIPCDRLTKRFEAARTAALEEAAQLVENECECSHGSSLYDAAARIRALKGTP